MNDFLLVLRFRTMLWMYLLFNLLFAYRISASDDIFGGSPCVNSNTLSSALTSVDLYHLSARFYSFCTEKYGVNSSNSGSTTHSCATSQCRSCLQPCKMVAMSGSSDCYTKCSGNDTNACKVGCDFFVGILRNHTSLTEKFGEAAASISQYGYDFMKLKWNATKTPSPVFYVVYAVLIDPHKPRKYNLVPINITRHVQLKVTNKHICKHFQNINHLTGISFSYHIDVVTKSGFVVRNTPGYPTQNSQAFKPVEAVTQLKVVGEPTLTSSTSGSYTINYQIQWQNVAGSPATRFLVRYEGDDCQAFNGATPAQYALPVLNGTTVIVHPNVLNTHPCDISLTVTSELKCLNGNTAKVTVRYKGCQMFANAPSQCVVSNTTVTPTTTPAPIIASISSEKFVCERKNMTVCLNIMNTCENCIQGYFNVTVAWKAPSSAGLLSQLFPSYKWRLYKARLFNGILVYVPEGIVQSTTETTAVLKKLQPSTYYEFKVVAEPALGPQKLPLWHSLQGLKFYTKAIPTPTIPPTTSKAFGNTSSFTPTKAPPNSKKQESEDKKTVALAAGLGSALFIVLLLFASFFIFEKRRRAKKDKNLSFKPTNFSCAHYRATPVDDWEIPIENIIFGEAIGEGAFGKVYTATVKGVTLNYSSTKNDSRNELTEVSLNNASAKQTGITMKAAVKILQDGSGELQRSEFLEEIKLMKEVGQHKNIVSMLACVTQSSPLCLVVEFMPFGDLLHYLRGRRSQIMSHPALYANEQFHALKYMHDGDISTKSTEHLMPYINNDEDNKPDHKMQNSKEKNEIKENGFVNSQFVDETTNNSEEITPEDLLRFSWQIASGMEFLAAKGFVHRDLAARNVLVGPNKSCKISDFGLSRLVYEEKVYMGKRSRKLPIKWMSIEAIVDQVFTTFSDVWSFGILLFEIVTLGGTPYPTLTSQAMLRLLKTGFRMEKPETCSDELYHVMMACWLENPSSRPTFTDIKDRLESLISEGTPYLEFDFDDSKPYYNVPSFRSIEDSAEDTDEEDDDGDDTDRRFSTLNRRGNGGEAGCQVEADGKEEEGKLKVQLDQEKEDRYAWPSKIGNQTIDV